MRDKAQNDYLLKLIGRDLSEWEKGGITPEADDRFFGVMVVWGVGSASIGYFLNGWVCFSVFLLWLAMCLGFERWVQRFPGRSWAQEVDIKLSMYQPIDLQAWEELKLRVAEEGVTLPGVQLWLDKELEALSQQPAKPEWLILQHSQGATTSGQPIKPEAKGD